jgi:hypothetical protein
LPEEVKSIPLRANSNTTIPEAAGGAGHSISFAVNCLTDTNVPPKEHRDRAEMDTEESKDTLTLVPPTSDGPRVGDIEMILRESTYMNNTSFEVNATLFKLISTGAAPVE